MKAGHWNSTHACLVLAAAVLTACGGGGGSSDNPPTPTASLTLSGTAATGAAIAGQPVEAKCAAGTGSATTKTDGTYTLSITGGVLPCLAKVTAGSTVLYTVVATGSGSAATANITPLTQLVVASLAGTDPATFYTAFTSSTAGAVTSATVTAATTAVVTTLGAAGITLTGVDPISGTLVAGSSTNPYDAALETLATTLASTGTTLETLTTTVAATSPAATTTTTGSGTATTSGVASLPADLLLQPAASNCSALRSGKYRVVHPEPGTTLANQYSLVTINASTLAIVYGDGTTGTWAVNGPCRYSDDAGKTDIVVTQAGVIVVRSLDTGTTFRPAIGFPVQTHTLAELAGTWNTLGLERNSANTAYTAIAATGTFDSVGALSAVTGCQNDTTWSVSGADCRSVTPDSSVKANADGGFDVVDLASSSVGARGFAYRSGSGDLMLVQVDGDGSFQLFTRQRTLSLPTVGTSTTFWNLTINNQLLMPSTVGQNSNTIQSVDSAAGSYVRIQKTVGGTNDHPETLLQNSPRNGYFFRAAGSALAIDGTTVSIGEFTGLNMRSMGFNPLISPASKTFTISAVQP